VKEENKNNKFINRINDSCLFYNKRNPLWTFKSWI